jgi:excisionase family DNA binding protein
MAKLTVKAAAQRAGVCTSVVYAWCAAGQLPHYRLGLPGRRGKVLIDEDDLDEFLDRFKVKPAVDPEPSPDSPRAVKLTHLRLPS